MSLRASSSIRARNLTSALLAVFVAVACTTVVTPPQAPREPTSVFVLREARHVGVVLPDEHEGEVTRYVEYGFGDWAWYALAQDEWYDVFATMLWPTQGALCRREYAAHSPAELRHVATWVELDELTVGRSEVSALRERLDAAFERGAKHAVFQADYDMTFVPYERHYWFANTCADVAGEWLRALGCEVSWTLIGISVAARRP